MQDKKRIQNVVTTSSFLLPVAAVCCALLWTVSSPISDLSHWIGLMFCILCTLLVAELNNTNVLIRVRTRMVATSFLVLWTCCGFLHSFQSAHIAVLCLLICYHALMTLYQQIDSAGLTFFIYLCLGSISIYIQPLCILGLIFYFVLGYFRSLTFKSFLAGILGFVLPFWLGFSICFLVDKLDLALNYLHDFSQWIPLQYHAINSHQLVSFVLLLIIVIPSIFHFLQNNYQDKIKVRMFFYVILWMELFLTIYILVLPHLFSELFLLLIMNSSPLIAHFFTLSNSKFCNYFFMVVIVLITLLTIFNLWMPSYNFF